MSIEPEQEGQTQSQQEAEENKKVLQWQLIPKIILRPPRTFFLKGMIFIDFNKKRISPVSNVNFYKHVSSSVILRDLGVFYEDISTNTSHFDSTSVVIQQLKNENNKYMNELADKLEGYEEFSKKNEMVKQQILSMILTNSQLKTLVISKRLEFDQLRKTKIASIQKHKYITFQDIAFDYADMQPKKTGTGMTEAFVKLLGCDLQSMQAISMRKGIISVIDDESRWQLMNKIINLVKSKMQEEFHYKGNMNIITLDDIVINVNFQIDSFLCKSGEIFQQFFHPEYKRYAYDRGILFFEFEITDSHVQQINQIRRQIINGNQEHRSIYDLDMNYYHPFILPESGNSALEQMQIKSFKKQLMKKICKGRINSKKQQVRNIQVCSKKYDEQQIICSIQPKVNNIVQNLANDIPYVVQSQDFLEKFYGTEVAKAAIEKSAKSNENDNADDEFKDKICGVTLKQW